MTISLTTVIEIIVGIIVSVTGWAVKQIMARQMQITADIRDIKTEVAVQSQRLHSHLQTEEVTAVSVDKRISELSHSFDTHRSETRDDLRAIYSRLNHLDRET